MPNDWSKPSAAHWVDRSRLPTMRSRTNGVARSRSPISRFVRTITSRPGHSAARHPRGVTLLREGGHALLALLGGEELGGQGEHGLEVLLEVLAAVAAQEGLGRREGPGT